MFEKLKKLIQPETFHTPQRLRIFFRPDRWKYVKKVEMEDGCVFCKAAKQKLSFETLTVYKTQYSMIVLNKFPYNSGHLLVIPHRHEGDFLKLTQAEYEDLHHCLRLAVQAVREVYSPHGINLGLNLDKAAGAGIPEHLHYHIVPRYHGDLNFFPLIAETKVVPEALEGCYEKYKNYFEVIK